MSIRKRKTKRGCVYDVTVSANGQRYYRTVDSLREARTVEAELKADYSQRDGRRDAITLRRYISAIYWPSAVTRLAATSLDTYEKEIRLRIVPLLGSSKLRDIDRALIQGALVDKCKTANVARKAIGVLKTILNEAVHDGYIKTNYATSKFAMPTATPRTRDSGLVLSTFEEIHALLDIVDEHAQISVQRMAYSGLLEGLRPEERYALDWSHIDLSAQTVTVEQAYVTASPRHGGVQLKTTKTKNGTRTIPIHPRFTAFLLSTPSTYRGAFIIGANGQRISPSTAQKQWRRFLRDNPSCPPVTLENMRHSFATAYLAAGGQIEVLSRILGHASIDTTINRYYRPDVTPLKIDFERISAYDSTPNRENAVNAQVRFSAPPPY